MKLLVGLLAFFAIFGLIMINRPVQAKYVHPIHSTGKIAGQYFEIQSNGLESPEIVFIRVGREPGQVTGYFVDGELEAVKLCTGCAWQNPKETKPQAALVKEIFAK